MRVELLYRDDDPRAMTLRQRLVEVLSEDAFETPIQMVALATEDDAGLLEMPGSPTVRLDGQDIYPEGITSIGLQARLYPPDDDLAAQPSNPLPGRRLIRRAVERARGWGHGRYA